MAEQWCFDEYKTSTFVFQIWTRDLKHVFRAVWTNKQLALHNTSEAQFFQHPPANVLLMSWLCPAYVLLMFAYVLLLSYEDTGHHVSISALHNKSMLISSNIVYQPAILCGLFAIETGHFTLHNLVWLHKYLYFGLSLQSGIVEFT